MTEAPLLSFCAAQIDVIFDLLPLWENEEIIAAGVEEGDVVLTHLTSLFKAASQALDSVHTAFFLGAIKKPERISPVVRKLLPRMIALGERIRRRYRLGQAAGSPTPQFVQFEEAIDQFRKDAVDFLKHWPWIDPERLAASEAAVKRGEYRDAREFLNELLHQAQLRSGDTDLGVEPLEPSHQ
jgi:hypothetical protein